MKDVMGDIKTGEQPAEDTKYNAILVTLTNGHTAVWEADKGEWDDYCYDSKAFIIKKNGAWVGLYNFDHIISIVVK